MVLLEHWLLATGGPCDNGTAMLNCLGRLRGMWRHTWFHHSHESPARPVLGRPPVLHPAAAAEAAGTGSPPDCGADAS